MPELTMVASWRVMIVRSAALTLSRPGSLSSLDPALSAMSTTMSPRDFSWSATACLLSASSSPLAWRPVRSTALNAYVLIVPGSRSLRGHQAGAHEAAQLVRMRRAGLGQLLRDLALAHERGQRGVHRLHARRGAGLHRREDLVRLALADEVA